MTAPTWEGAKRAGKVLVLLIAAAAILYAAARAFAWLTPRHDPTPIVVSRKDEQTAGNAADAVAANIAGQNHDSTVHVDITTKEIRDAFDAPPPAPVAGAAPALPAAPVERLHDALNEGIARANRAADTAEAAR